MVGIQIGKEQEERKREEEGLNFETTPWWNFITIMGYADEELRSASLLKLRAQPTAKAKAKAMHHMEGGLWSRDKKEDQEGNGDFQKTLAGLGNEGIAFEAKRSSVLGIRSLCTFVQ